MRKNGECVRWLARYLASGAPQMLTVIQEEEKLSFCGCLRQGLPVAHRLAMHF